MENQRKKRFGDRKDGRRLRSLDPFYTLMPYIMKERSDASNLFADKIEIRAAEVFLRKVRSEGLAGVGFLHLLIASYIRCVSQFPALNRFISGRRIYARNNIEIVMTIKKKLTVDSGETAFKVAFQPTDGLYEVCHKINDEIDKIKNASEKNGTESAAATFMKMPRLFLRACLRFLSWLDYHGRLPKALLDVSPFHGSLVITDLGSLGIGTIFHHLYNFGNVPLFLSFGAKYCQFMLNNEGKPIEKKYIDFSIVCDERICDGHYFSIAARHLKYYLKNPEILTLPPENVVEDVE